ncbi:MAG: FapA family protein [Sulfuricella sp.]
MAEESAVDELPTDESPAQEQQLTLALSEDGRKLLASVSPGSVKAPFDLATLKQEIDAQGYGQLFLIDAVLNQLVKQYASASEPFTLEIGEVRDAGVKVELAPDKMTAWISVTPPCGGTAVTTEQIRSALAEKQVTSGFLDEAIEQIMATGEATRQPVAQGRAVVNGEDGKLQCLIEMVKQRHPHFDEQGVADYRDLGGIVTVHQGECLMQKIPATMGEPGENVLGQTIPAKPGKEATFAPQLKGALVDPQDPAFLIAEISGQPLLVNNGMAVEPTINLATVDLTTGNIDFEGTVNISGDVHAGMSIHATGDIHVGGTVEAAILEAGGDVVIKGGIIGHGEIHAHPDDKNRAMIARVHCGTSFSARFVENASIEVGDSIMVDELVMQSELAAVNQIVVGKPGSGQGRIMGGVAEATLLVQAATIGSPSGVKTRVIVGTNPYLHEKLRQAGKHLEAKSKELDEVVKLIKFIEDHPDRIKPEIKQKAENTFQALLDVIELAQQDKDELTKQLELSVDAKVIVEKTLYGNVQIEIGGKVHWVDLQRGSGTFVLKEDEIVFE